MKLDLHCHSSASDGAWPPERLADEIERRRIMAWALTDHDSVDGWRAIRSRPGLICGAEISTRSEDREIHVVALGVDPDAAGFAALLERNVAIRRERAAVILDHVHTVTGVRLALEDCQVPGAGMITRSHIATAMVRARAVPHHYHAFAEVIGDSMIQGLYQPAYASPAEAAATIHDAGGVAILAHPAMYGDIHLIERLMSGLDGLEVKHPHLEEPLQRLLVQQAQQHGWLLSAGSDFHREPCRLGDWRLSRGQAAPLLAAIGWRDPITGQAIQS